ncbi:MAG: hypothetical protein IV107_16010 [Paucibacter sp.]|nr:hypothetical protein [Roseateles sp.]
MDRLAEQVVAWHNRHPLAKRITIYDVHTMGVVALPFMRNAPADAAARHAGGKGKVEPVLTDEISAESLAAAWEDEGLTIAAHPNAAHLDALADQEPLPRPDWRARLSRLMFWRKPAGAAALAKSWPVFSERFVSHLSPRRIAAFAQAQGYTKQPGDATWPQRIVPIDEALMETGSGGGAWPYELYVMSAAIDAGRSRSRILIGRGRQPQILGRRCLSPRRLGLVALLLLAVLGAGAGLLLPAAKKSQPAVEPAVAAASAASSSSAASAVSAVLPIAAAPASAAVAAVPATAASVPMPEPIPAAAASTAALLPASSAATASTEAATEPAASEENTPPRPDIRPIFIKPIPGRTAPPLGARPKEEPAAADAQVPPAPQTKPEPIELGLPKPKARSPLAHDASKPKLSSAAEPASAVAVAPTAVTPRAAPPDPKAVAKAAALVNKPVVALVGPVSANKADAEATLARMRNMLAPSQGGAGGAALQAQVFQTPEGWRPAVWPFASREEAQLINATLIARGMRTRAVDF